MIGLRDLYVQLQSLDRATNQLGAKVDTSMQLAQLSSQSTAQQLADIRHDLNDHEARLRTRESQNFVTPRSMWMAIGVITSIVGVVTTVIVATFG